MTFLEQLEKTKNSNIKKIGEYLLTRDDIKEKLENDKKSLDKMFIFITSEAKKLAVSGCAMISDETVYGWAVHYYDEEMDIDKQTDLKAIPTVKEATKKDVKPKVKAKEKPEHTFENLTFDLFGEQK